ncbi:MAG: SpoIID/LytB domain protein, partial [Firmicutes bacterium]|nr:SpoIID/LytB domain protein [Bacillota bacterium]
MNCKLITILLGFLSCVLFLVGTVYAAQASESNIRVGIWSNQRNILVSADVEYEIVNVDKNQTLGRFSANEKATIAYNGNGFILNGKK